MGQINQLVSNPWRIRIAAECARLESVYRETYRGFKSLILRKLPVDLDERELWIVIKGRVKPRNCPNRGWRIL